MQGSYWLGPTLCIEKPVTECWASNNPDTGYYSTLTSQTRLQAIGNGVILQLRGFAFVKKEFEWGNSRFDFLLQRGITKCIVEVKASTLLRGKVAMFPDAPTVRGAKHLTTLASALRYGYRACMLFMVHRQGALTFSPNADTDPAFFEAFCDATALGVEAYAFQCEWKGRRVDVNRSIPLLLGGQSKGTWAFP